jgi:hypothetical protein
VSAAIRIVSSFVFVLAAAVLIAGCDDDQSPSSTTGAKPVTGVPGVPENAVLEFEGDRYLLVSLVPSDESLPGDNTDVREVGTGTVRSAEGDTEITVYEREAIGDDGSVYTRAPQPQQGGADVSEQLYQWKLADETSETTPGPRNDPDDDDEPDDDDDDDGLAP